MRAPLALLSALSLLRSEAEAMEIVARAVMWDAQGLQRGSGRRVGLVEFRQSTDNSWVTVQGNITLAGPGLAQHGFHVHETGDMSNGCTSFLGHFNPDNAPHGAPKDAPANRHVGDLGNVQSFQGGQISINLRDENIQLHGRKSVIGRGLILHRDQDDLGRGPYPDSRTTGHAGPRLACGLIGLVSASPALPASSLLFAFGIVVLVLRC